MIITLEDIHCHEIILKHNFFNAFKPKSWLTNIIFSDYAYDYARSDEQKQPEKASFSLDGQQGNIEGPTRFFLAKVSYLTYELNLV